MQTKAPAHPAPRPCPSFLPVQQSIVMDKISVSENVAEDIFASWCRLWLLFRQARG